LQQLGGRQLQHVPLASCDSIDTGDMGRKVASAAGPAIDLVAMAVENLPDIVEICDRDGRFLYVNKAFERLTGWTLSDVAGRTPADVLRSGAHTDAYYEEMENTVLSGKIWTGRIISRTRTGDLLLQDLVLSPLYAETGEVNGIVALKRDITAKEPMEAQLLLADRLAAVGQLAAGVAHEINNPLSYVLGNLAFLSEEISALRSVVSAAKIEELESALADTVRSGSATSSRTSARSRERSRRRSAL
jgi:PAS domain S-box-containing protein